MMLTQSLRRATRHCVSVLAIVAAAGMVATLVAPAPAEAQAAQKKKGKDAKSGKAAKTDSTGKATGDSAKKAKPPKPPLFEAVTPLPLTLTTNQKAFFKDKGDNAPLHPATLTVSVDGKNVDVPLRVHTRGIWRLKHCEFPPTRLKFTNKDTKGTPLHDLDDPKLVSFCKNSDSYEQYILQEFQLYRIYQLLTPFSHKARLVHMTYADSMPGKQPITRYAFILEDPAQVALRNNGKILKQKGAVADDLDKSVTAILFLFEDLIGNTDFSIAGLHNAQLVATTDGINYPVAFDFDFSGAVDAIYATPDPKLGIKTVRERQFRGYCSLKDEFEKTLPLFQEKKAAIYALYSDEIGQLMSPKVVKQTLAYFDEFYDSIKTPRDVKRMLSTCVD
jgi:hypothetical protein